MPASLPLKEAARIVRDNALRIGWDSVCPPAGDGEETFIAGNPPYYGAKKRSEEQNADMEFCGLGGLQALDYVAAWLEKVSLLERKVSAALVVTSSIRQGEKVAPLWTRLLDRGLAIEFAYRPFRWRNSAADVAGVMVTIVGLSRTPSAQRRIFDGGTVTTTTTISPYLAPGGFTPVRGRLAALGDLPEMTIGSNPVDGKHLIFEREEAGAITAAHPGAARFLRTYMGGQELLYDTPKVCLWIGDGELEAAREIPALAARIDACGAYRRTAGRDARRAAARPHAFCYSTWEDRPALMVPNTQSEERLFIPAARAAAGIVINHNAFAIYDAPEHVLAVVASSLHRVWLATVGGRLDNRYRYAVSLVYNSFPTPRFTSEQKDALARSARRILRARYELFPMTLAELYDPRSMPQALAAAHAENDALLETMYIGRPFRNDTERLERLFRLTAACEKKEG